MLGAKAPHLGQHRPVAGRAWVGKERDAGHGLVAADRLYRQALPVIEDDVDRLDAVADRDPDLARLGREVEQRAVGIVRESAALVPVGTGALGGWAHDVGIGAPLGSGSA